MLDDRPTLALLGLAAAVLGLAAAGVTAVVTSFAGLAALGAAAGSELRAARDAGVPLGSLSRPPGLRYLLIAFPFLFAVSAVGEEHLLAVVGAAVLTQAAYVRRWRLTPTA